MNKETKINNINCKATEPKCTSKRENCVSEEQCCKESEFTDTHSALNYWGVGLFKDDFLW